MKWKQFTESIAGLASAVLFVSCSGNNLDKIKIFEQPEQMPGVVIEDLRTLYTQNGVRKGHLETPLLHLYRQRPDPYYEFPNGMRVEMYDRAGQYESEVTANYAKYFVNEGTWEARYNVRAVNTKGDTLETEHVFIYEKEERIFSEVQVQITSKDGMRIVGKDGFNSNLDFTEYQFKNVTGIFNVKMGQVNAPTDTVPVADTLEVH